MQNIRTSFPTFPPFPQHSSSCVSPSSPSLCVNFNWVPFFTLFPSFIYLQIKLTSFFLYLQMPQIWSITASSVSFSITNFFIQLHLSQPHRSKAEALQPSCSPLEPPSLPMSVSHTFIDSSIPTFSPLVPVKLINSHLCLCHVWVNPQWDHLLSVLRPELSVLFHSFGVENKKFLTNFLIIKIFLKIFLKCMRKKPS